MPCPLRGSAEVGAVLRTIPVDRRGTAHINDNDETAGRWTWPADSMLGRASAEWTDELPWQPVAPGEAAGLITAYRQARLIADELHATLVAAGVDPDELTELCPSLDAAGRPVVVLGRVSARTARQLCDLLGRPDAA
jgi:hypothetical protein